MIYFFLFLCIFFTNFLLWSSTFFVWFTYFGLFVYFAYFFSLFIYFVWVSICSIEIIKVEVLPSSDFLMESKWIKGIVYGKIAEPNIWRYGVNKNAFNSVYNDNFFYSKGIMRKNLYLEAISKVNHHRIYEELNPVVKDYVPKGGDLILKNENDVFVIELKNRIGDLDNKKILKKYAHNLVNAYAYDKNMIITVECNTSSITHDLMNYTKELKGKEFCFDKADLQKPEVIMELQTLSMKPNFEQLVIQDASHYHNFATETDLAFAKSTMEELSQYTREDITEFEKNRDLDIVECFENPNLKVNQDLKKAVYIYENFYYGRSEK